jgi:hypothetical protein
MFDRLGRGQRASGFRGCPSLQTRLTFIVDATLAVLRVGHRTLSRRDPSRRREREIPELPILEKNRDDGSTAVVDFWTSRDVREVVRSHLNFAQSPTPNNGSNRRPT